MQAPKREAHITKRVAERTIAIPQSTDQPTGSRISRAELDRIRRYRRKTLKAVAESAGLSLYSAWAVVSGKSFDLRKIAAVSVAIGINPNDLDIQSFIPDQARLAN